MCGFGLTTTIYLVTYWLLRKAAAPVYAPLKDGGQLLSGGEDMNQHGVLESAVPIEIRARVDIRFYLVPEAITVVHSVHCILLAA